MGLTSIVALELQRDRHHKIGKKVYHKIAWLAHLMQMPNSLISKSQMENFIWLMLVLGLVIIFSFHIVVCTTTLLGGGLQIFSELFHAITYHQFIYVTTAQLIHKSSLISIMPKLRIVWSKYLVL